MSSSSCPPFIADAVTDLKRKALAAKKDGDIPAAKAFLQQARELESPTTSQSFQRLAMIYKRNGDLERAKDALRQSKLLKMDEEAEPEPMDDEEESNETGNAIPLAPVSTKTNAATPKYNDPVNQAIDDANLEELTAGVSYTIEEMIDVETMTDMKDAGMPIPPAAEYQQRAVACKRKALLAKESKDIAGAKKFLVLAKELLAASERLYAKSGGTDQANDDDDDGEDYSLLDELMGDGEKEAIDDDGFIQELFGAGATAVELDDLDDMDPDMLKDMIEAGMTVPDVEEIIQQSKQKKTMALNFKKEGNMVAAKSALEESKRFEHKAKQLADLLKNVGEGSVAQDNLDPDAMLEAMMRATDREDERQSAATKETTQTTTQATEPLKPSHEYKTEAVMHRQANRMDEALAALKLYKQALAVENSAAEAKKRKECQQILEQEVNIIFEQIRCFRFYQRFVDHAYGGEQMEAWKSYLKRCKSMLQEATNGGAVPDMSVRSATPNAKRFLDGNKDLEFVGSTSTDPRIEVSILEFFDITANKHFRKHLEGLKNKDDFILTFDSVRLQGVVQLPPSADLPEDNVEFSVSAASYEDEMFRFDHSLFVNVERGNSRFAKLLRRRLARRRVTIDVLLIPVKKKSFWQSQGTAEPVSLGTAIVDLKHLLDKSCVAGDFPLLDITRRHELGGKVRMAVSTNRPFEEMPEPETAAAGASTLKVDLHPYFFLTLGNSSS